jgi:ABC-type bacteriocin/lantibiotic exporter with double-glycine peptidase domain
MLLALHDLPVEHAAIEKYTTADREGISLDEIKDATNALGLRTHVRYCSLEELRRTFRSPILVRLRYGIRHHYVVMIGMTSDTVTLLDGTTGAMEKHTIPWLEARWSGYVLMPDEGLPILWLGLGISLCAWTLLGVFGLKRFIRKSDSRAALT